MRDGAGADGDRTSAGSREIPLLDGSPPGKFWQKGEEKILSERQREIQAEKIAFHLEY